MKRYFYLLDKYIKFLGTAKHPIILGHLVCVGEIIGYSHKKIKADIKENLKLSYRYLMVYVLTNYWSSFDEDLKRIYWLRDNGFDPYVMIYNKANAPQNIKHMQRWVNNKWIFKSTNNFEDYNPKLR